MVRNYTGLFIDYGTIDEGKIANEIGCGRKKVEAVLRELARDGLVQYQPASELPQITFLLNRPEDHSFYFEPSRYLERESNAKKRLTAILEYASNFECRQVQILRYFSEESEPCGLCDVCRGSLDTEFTLEEKLKLDKHLADSLRKRPLTLNQYLLLFPFNKRAKARRVVLALVAEQKYRIDLGKLIKTR